MFDAYAVAIRLRLVDHFSGVMGMVIGRLAEGHAHADKLQKKLDGIGRLLTGGALTTGAGIGLALALKASTNEAVRYEQQLNRLKALNLDARFGAGTTRGLEQKAAEIGERTKGTSKRDALRLITETQSITGDVKHTFELAPMLAKIKFGLETYMAAGGKGSGHGEKGEQQFRDIVKVMELRGLMRNFSEAQADRMGDLFVKNYVASGGQVKPSDFLAMMKTGGVAAKVAGEDYMFALGHIMQEKGGSRAGTGLMSGYQSMIAGRTTQQVAEQLLKYGLLKPGSIEYGTTGHIKKVRPEALKAAALYQESPLQFLLQELTPALAKKGVDVNDAKRVIPIINQLFSNRTGADQMASLYLERSQIQNYMAQAKNAMGVNLLYNQAGKSTTGQQIDLESKVTDLEREFGNAALPLLKASLEQAIPLVKDMGRWMNENQNGLSMLVKGIAGLAIAMAVSGPLIVLTGAIKGLRLAAGLGEASAGIFSHKLSQIPWTTSIGKIDGAGNKLRALGDTVAAFGIGWTVGTVLHDTLLEGTKFDNMLGRLTAKFLHFLHIGGDDVDANDRNENAVDRMLHRPPPKPQENAVDRTLRQPAPPPRFSTVQPRSFSEDHSRRQLTVQPPAQAPIEVTANLHLDGQKVASVVTKHQAREAVRPFASNSGFDPTLMVLPVGAN
jgi:hypothetical protein